MNSLQRFANRLAGRPVDRPPNQDIFMTFAAHHIGRRLSDYYLDHRVLVSANLAVLADFELDIVQAISDPYREAADFGLKVEFPADGLPVARQPRIAEPAGLRKLVARAPASGRRMSDRLEALRLFREQVGGHVPIMGWVEGALAEAADLRGAAALLMDLVERPEWVEELLETCASVAIAFAQAQVEAGADVIGLGDALASQVSPAMYRRFALPYEQRVFRAVHDLGATARLHICGNTTRLLAGMVASGADVIDLDWMVDMAAAASRFGDQVSFLGNMDPVAVMLQGSPQDVYRATTACLVAAGPRGISGAGCEIPNGTPPDNLRAQTRAIRDYGTGR